MAEGKDDNCWSKINYEDIELGEIIGGGGVGLIYNGYVKGMSDAVALKTLFDPRVSDELRREYIDELLVLSRVNHSNIVKFLGACMTPPHLFFVMELCDCSLFDKLHKFREQITMSDVLRMAIDIGSAMEYLHAQNPVIIHRDLKSLNVLQAYNGSMKLCDFGLVKVRNTQAGTPAYMAPELLENKPFNKSVDVYAFGIMLCEMCAQEIPFFMVDINDIREKVLNDIRPHLPVSNVPSALDSLIKRSWSTDCRDRPDFTEIVDKLYEIQDNLPNMSTRNSIHNQYNDALDSLLKK